MGKDSGIEWTNETWNPWQGCHKVSPACAYCYMYSDKARYGQDPEVVVRSKPRTFRFPLRLKSPTIIFTCSWSDWFHKDADDWREEAYEIIRQTPQHIYQILTKRSERIADHLPDDWGEGYPNVWLGVSVENQRWTTRIDDLIQVPAKVRFISAEPLLGSLDLSRYLKPGGQTTLNPPLNWVITGGESGPRQREMNLDHARSLRDQCAEASVPFFLKQLGGHPDKRGGAKALLDGVRHVEMPVV